uniref:Uncharacterized protein n=1 Tax=Scleropages formosus TaxID=113540 RepID=A0A8C9V5Q1_SCLFO
MIGQKCLDPHQLLQKGSWSPWIPVRLQWWKWEFITIILMLTLILCSPISSDASAELIMLRTAALQNRLTLDHLLAAQGGTCAVISLESCSYIPDNSKCINSMADHIRETGALFHDFEKPEFGLLNWLSSLLGSWGSWII